VSTDYFQNRTNSFEATRKTLESPGERERTRASLASGSQPVVRTQTAPARSITWGTTVKISMAVYFALLGVLVTTAVVVFLVVRFGGDQFREFKADWQSLPSVSQSPTIG
jgi:hypothetical protein